MFSHSFFNDLPHNVLLVRATIGGSDVHLAVQIARLLRLLVLLMMVVVVVLMVVGPTPHRRGAVLVRAVLGDVVKGGGRGRAA